MNRFIKSICLLELQSMLICRRIYNKNTLNISIKEQLIRALIQTNSFRSELILRVKFYCNDFKFNYIMLYLASLILKPFYIFYTIINRTVINRHSQMNIKIFKISNINDATLYLSKIIKEKNFEK